MIKSSIKYMLMGVAALAIASLPVQAADKAEKVEGQPKKEATEKAAPSKGDKAARAIPFHGTLASKTDASITVGGRTFQVTSETKIMKDGKPATLASGEVGKEVAGQYREQDGKLVTKMIRFGAKPEAKEGEQPKTKANKPAKEKKAE